MKTNRLLVPVTAAAATLMLSACGSLLVDTSSLVGSSEQTAEEETETETTMWVRVQQDFTPVETEETSESVQETETTLFYPEAVTAEAVEIPEGLTDKETAILIRNMLDEDRVDVSPLCDRDALGEIMRESGFGDYTASWLLDTLYGDDPYEAVKESYTYEEPETQEAETEPVTGEDGHSHDYYVSLSDDEQYLDYVCTICGDYYRQTVKPAAPDAVTDEEWEYLYSRITRRRIRGNESTKYDDPESYILNSVVNDLYCEWGELHYSWSYDNDAATLMIHVTLDGIEDLKEKMADGDSEAAAEWKFQTAKVRVYSKYARRFLYDAGYTYMQVDMSLVSSNDAIIYEAKNGTAVYDLYDQISEARSSNETE